MVQQLPCYQTSDLSHPIGHHPLRGQSHLRSAFDQSLSPTTRLESNLQRRLQGALRPCRCHHHHAYRSHNSILFHSRPVHPPHRQRHPTLRRHVFRNPLFSTNSHGLRLAGYTSLFTSRQVWTRPMENQNLHSSCRGDTHLLRSCISLRHIVAHSCTIDATNAWLFQQSSFLHRQLRS